MKKQNNFGFTLAELVIVIAIISILSAIIIPTLAKTYTQSKENIIDIYNNETVVFCYCDEVLLYEGSTDDLPDFSTEYKLIDIKTYGNIIYMYYEKI